MTIKLQVSRIVAGVDNELATPAKARPGRKSGPGAGRAPAVPSEEYEDRALLNMAERLMDEMVQLRKAAENALDDASAGLAAATNIIAKLERRLGIKAANGRK